MSKKKLVKLSSRGQLVIPAEMRRALDLGRGDRIAVEIDDGQLILSPVREEDWQSLEGSLRDGPSLTDALKNERRRERERDSETEEEFE